MQFEPDEDNVVLDVQPIVDHLSRIMESAVDEAIGYYKEKSRSVNIQTIPDLVRDAAKHLLEVHPLPEQPYELEPLSRNGLSLLCHGHYYEAYHIKILKTDSGVLPVLGASQRKECFFRQLPLWFAALDSSSNDEPSNILPFRRPVSVSQRILNLVFTWDVDLKTGMICLALICPKNVKTDYLVVYWNRSIEHTALRIAKEQPQPVYTEDVDYGISLPALGKLGNGQEDD